MNGANHTFGKNWVFRLVLEIFSVNSMRVKLFS